jgi:hypothetical protein
MKLSSATVAMAFLFSVNSNAGEWIKSQKVEINPSSIDQVFRLVDKNDPGTSHKKLQIVTTDHGMSTDLSPRYSVYLGYASLAEMGNISADFKITDQAMKVISATRLSAGVYEVRVKEFLDDEIGMLEMVYTIDATSLFSDEKKLREKCGGDFCDEDLKTKIWVTRTSTAS